MAVENFLQLRLIQLDSSKSWFFDGEGICFIFPKDGCGKYVRREESHAITPGDVLVINDRTGGNLQANGGSFGVWAFSLHLEHLYPLFTGGEISLLQGVIDNFKGARLFPASSAHAKRCHQLIAEISPEFNLTHRSQLLRVASVVLTEEFKLRSRETSGCVSLDEHVKQVLKNLSADELSSLSVGQLAERFGYSRRHLNRLFHEYFGLSVAALRMEMRLLKSVSLLRNTNEKIINVAGQCKFYHLGLFNRCFKRRFGRSPSEWRRQNARHERNIAGSPYDSLTCRLQPSGLCPLKTGDNDYCVSPL